MAQKKDEKGKCDKDFVCSVAGEFLGRFSETAKHVMEAEKEILLAAKSFLEVGIDLLDHKKSHMDAKKKKARMEKVEIS